jgi:hypothetical protein
MTKEQIPVRGMEDLMGQLYSLAREYPQFSGYAFCMDSGAEIRAVVGQGSDQTVFEFINDDPRLMKQLYRDMASIGCVVGDEIDPKAIIRRVDRRKAVSRRSRTWMLLGAQTFIAVALAAGVSAWISWNEIQELNARVARLEAENKSLRGAGAVGAEVPEPMPETADTAAASPLDDMPQ